MTPAKGGHFWKSRAAALLVLPLLAAGCGHSDPFGYVRVSGKVVYEDGSAIPVEGIVVTFYPQGGAIDEKTHPRPGVTVADKGGEFHDVTSHMPNDGLVRGRHKVTLKNGSGFPLPPELVPPEYYTLAATPLEVDTSQQPFVLKVRKPSGHPKAANRP